MRLAVLEAVAGVGVSIDFLKLTPSGLSFIVPEATADAIREALKGIKADVDVFKDRSIVLVHAVNIRDEEGLVARIVRQLIHSGANVDHIGDMHDRLLMVLERSEAKRVAELFQGTLVEATDAR